MTPKEIEAKDKAKEIIDFYKGSYFHDSLGRAHDVLDDDFSEIAKALAMNRCEELIYAIGSIKGMGKISKLNFWKNVKSFVEEYKNED